MVSWCPDPTLTTTSNIESKAFHCAGGIPTQDHSPSWGTQYTGPSSVLSKDEKEALDDHDGEGCSSPEGGSRKLQLSVLSRS